MAYHEIAEDTEQSSSFTMDLMPAQQRFMHVAEGVDSEFCLYQGGFGSGKTAVGTLKVTLMSLKYNGLRSLIGAENFRLLEDAVKPAIDDYLKGFGLIEGKDYKFQTSRDYYKYRFANGSEILLRSLKFVQRLRSINFGLIYLEEGSLLAGAVFNEVVGRLRQNKGQTPQVLICTNPEASKGWLYELFKENKIVEVPTRDGNVKRVSYRKIIAPSTDNIHLPETFLAQMKAQYDEEYYRIFVLGEDGDYTSGLVVKNWDDELNRTTHEFDPKLNLYLTCDFNVDPMCWIVFQRFNDEFHYFDELVIENTNTPQVAREFARRYPHKTVSKLIITGDASGDSRNTQNAEVGGTNYTLIVNTLMENGWPSSKILVDLRKENPHVLDRVAAFNSAVMSQAGVRRVFIHDRCKWLKYDIKNLMFKVGTSDIDKPTQRQKAENRNSKFLTHPFDAASYPIEKYLPIVRRPEKRKEFKSPIVHYE